MHDPGKVLPDVALGVALGGDCLADVATLRAEPAVFGPVASDPTVSRLIDALAAAGPKALTAIRTARAEVRSHAWELAGPNAAATDGSVIVDIGGVLVLAHSEKQDATATWKKTFGHHPLVEFVDHGQAGSGEPVAALLRPGNAGSNTASDHIATTGLGLAQLPKRLRPTGPARPGPPVVRRHLRVARRGFRIEIATVYRYIREAVNLLAVLAPTLEQAMVTVRKKPY